MHNNHLHHMHTEVNNLKLKPYRIFLTCEIQINHYIYIHITKIAILT